MQDYIPGFGNKAGDELTLTATCQADGVVPIGFGECTGLIQYGGVAP